VQAAASGRFWIYNTNGRLVSTLSFGAAGPGGMPSWQWATDNMAPGVYRVKSIVDYDDGTTFEGWRTIAIVP
jgi:hypothetical protein